MKALFIIFMTVWVLFACNNQQSNQQQFVSDILTNREFFKQIDTLNKETSKQTSDSLIYIDKNIVNHRFFRINIDKKGDTILFDPCYASIATILMQKNVLYTVMDKKLMTYKSYLLRKIMKKLFTR